MPKHGTACDDRSLQPGWTTTPPGRLGAAASSCRDDFYRPEESSTTCSLQKRPQALDSRQPATSPATTGAKPDISTGGGGGAGNPAGFDRPAARLLSEDAGGGGAPPCEPRPGRRDGQATDTTAAFKGPDQSAELGYSTIRASGATDSSTFTHSRWRAPCSWLQFPPEIRNMIYAWSLQLPDSRTLYSSYYSPDPDSDPDRDPAHKRMASGADQSPSPPPALSPPFRPRLRTPTILLLCRLITAECLPILRSGWLVIDRPPPWQPGHPHPTPLTAFIPPATLQHLRRIDIRPSLAQGRFGSWWAWRGVVEELVGVLLERNCFAELRVLLKMHNVELPNVWRAEWLGQKALLKKIKDLQSSNPRFWKPGLVRVEVWRVDEYEAKKLHAGNLLENYELDLDRMEEIRSYPDAEFWPGSVLEFL